MRLNKFEKHIAKKVNEYPSELDTESLWNTLESDLEKKKKRRILFIFWRLFPIVAIGSLGLFVFQLTQNQSIATEISAAENTKSSNQELNPPIENISKNKNTSSVEEANSTDIPEPFKIQNKAPDLQATDIKNENTPNQTAVLIEQNIFRNNQTNSIFKNNNTQDKRTKDLGKIASLNLTKVDFIEKENNLSTKKNLRKINPTKNWSLYLTPTFGVYYTDRKITQKNDPGAALRDLRNSSEKSLETLSIGVGIELKNKNNFFLISGIHFNQITELFNNQSSEFTTEDIEIVTEINYFSNGDREEIMGTYEQQQETISITKVYNTIRWAEINVGGGYYFSKKRWTVGASAGLLWGTMLNAEGKILDAENNMVEIKNQNSDIYRNQPGLGAFTNLEVRYALQPRLRLSAQFGYKNMQSSFTAEDYPLEIKYQWLGAAVGLHYKIF